MCLLLLSSSPLIFSLIRSINDCAHPPFHIMDDHREGSSNERENWVQNSHGRCQPAFSGTIVFLSFSFSHFYTKAKHIFRLVVDVDVCFCLCCREEERLLGSIIAVSCSRLDD